MNILFYILLFLVPILAVITKRKLINSQNGKKYTYREFIIDLMRIILITIIYYIYNWLYGKDIPILSLIIDFSMMIVYLLPLSQKNYNYTDRKSFRAIWASCIIIILGISVIIFQMIIGTYNKDNIIMACDSLKIIMKGILYLLIAIWCYSTTEKSEKIRNKIKLFFSELKKSFKNFELNTLDYYVLVFLELFIFTGYKGYFYPLCIFGLHELINKKKLKGGLFIVFGNICIILQYMIKPCGNIAIMIYFFVVFFDILIHTIVFLKNFFKKKAL